MEKMEKPELVEMITELESALCWLEKKLSDSKEKKTGRKEEVLKCFEGGAVLSVGELSKIVGISDRNISSQLSYLRKDGYEFIRIGSGSGKLKLVGRPLA